MSYKPTYRRFCANFWSKFWGLGVVNQKSKNNVLYFCHGELMAKMARFHRETKNEEAMFVTDGRTYRQSQRQKNNRLLAIGAEINRRRE